MENGRVVAIEYLKSDFERLEKKVDGLSQRVAMLTGGVSVLAFAIVIGLTIAGLLMR